MSLVVLVPLLMTLLTCLGATLFVIKRKSEAQALCVNELATLQNGLKAPLTKLLRMNPAAEALRFKREAADEALKEALASALPPAIATAQAYQAAVILEQTEFGATQLRLLAEAERLREESHRRLPLRLRFLNAEGLHNDRFYYRPLAVEPKPVHSLSPNYEKVPLFTQAQQQRVRFETDLRSHFPIAQNLSGEWRQKTECAVSLDQDQGGAWDIKILKAKAL